MTRLDAAEEIWKRNEKLLRQDLIALDEAEGVLEINALTRIVKDRKFLIELYKMRVIAAK